MGGRMIFSGDSEGHWQHQRCLSWLRSAHYSTVPSTTPNLLRSEKLLTAVVQSACQVDFDQSTEYSTVTLTLRWRAVQTVQRQVQRSAPLPKRS
jgi:hypothetical protein